jgi:hypothetical protein
MIKNERQYRITKTQVHNFESALRRLESGPATKGVHPTLYQAQVDALRSQLRDLREELGEYEALRREQPAAPELELVQRLPNALIQARIAAGLTQAELAEKVGIKPQQIQRYEATNYQAASLQRVAEVVRALGPRRSSQKASYRGRSGKVLPAGVKGPRILVARAMSR